MLRLHIETFRFQDKGRRLRVGDLTSSFFAYSQNIYSPERFIRLLPPNIQQGHLVANLVFTEVRTIMPCVTYPAELTGSQNSCQLNIRRISIVCNNVYAISTIVLLYYIYVFIFIYLYV